MRKALTLLIIPWLFPGLIRGDTTPGSAAGPPQSRTAATGVNATFERPTAGLAEVSAISVQDKTEGQTFIDVATTRPASYHVLRLRKPERLVVDIEGVRNLNSPKMVTAQSALLKAVRVGQFRAKDPAVVRVVADLASDPAFDVHAVRGGVRIELRSRTLAVRPTVLPVSGRDATLRALDYAGPRLPKSSSGSSQNTGPLVAASGNSVRELQPVAQKLGDSAPREAGGLDYQKALPALTGSREVTASRRAAEAEQSPESLQAAKAARIVAGEPGESQGQPTASTVITSQEKSKYTGEPISLNLKDLDVKDFFRLIHELSGLNILVDPDVSGSVTMVLDSVPWDQALEIVLKNNGLDRIMEGNVLRIAKVGTLTAEQDSVARLVTARQDAQPLVTVFRPLNYAKAATVATLLKSWVGGGALSKRGTVLLDDRTNTLIISDIQSQIPVIESIIGKLDKKAKQVQIESRIILATASFQNTLQAALTAGTVNRSTTTVTGGSTGSGASTTVNIVPPPRITIGQTSAAGFGSYAISNLSARYFISAAIAAAENRSEAKTISRPTIVTQNNVPGMVQQGAQIPIQTTVNNTISIQYIAATLSLNVTPQVTDDGHIFLVINVQNASPGPALTNAGPSINTQSATTQVLVEDGGTVVFGGITVSARTKSATYVPLLGNIPVLGHLFKTSNVQDSDNELLFFISPKVLPG